MADVYDSDDACRRSPGLQPAVVKYGPDEPSPPFPHKRSISQDRPSPPGDWPDKSRKHHRPHKYVRPTQGDAVLIGIIDPNRPDIAMHAAERPLRSDSDSDDDYRERVRLSPRPSGSASLQPSQVASVALDLVPKEHPPTTTSSNNHNHNNVLPPISELVSQDSVFAPLPYHRHGSEQVAQDGLATSGVAKYAISPSNMPAQELLPALQSPPHSTAGSPENTQSLPPVQSLLRDLSSVSVASMASSHYGTSAPSPVAVPPPSRRVSTSLPPPPPLPPSQLPTPYSHASPMSMKELTAPSPAAQSPYSSWRPPGYKTEASNVSTVYETSSQGPLPGKSPANNYPTPTETRPSGEEHPEAGNLYKCDFPDCNAPPFQTQYLLNSHANVHSQERPHYCPVPNCPRGVGGKGFKRKNEMIRHGLVHDSPGYVCPFCTDQQHKYPRPDNLQRHVKAHHVDRSKDDPELRSVLAQRPKGSGRGRRRRGHT